jgi:aryl-alcohol dehydrogenase-like predicted oxidoreductase
MTTTSTHAVLSKYTYGTTRLGDENIPLADRIAVARAAMDAGVWFHTSDQYGSAQSVLHEAFSQDQAHIPNLIFKIGWSTIDELRGSITKQLAAVGADKLQIGQLCLGGELADDLRSGGNGCNQLRALKEEGIVDRFVIEVFPWTSEMPLEALRGGHTDGIVDAFIFYLNPLQRFASNKLWDLIQDKNFPIVAMRTVSGGDVHRLRDIPGAAWKPYLHDRAVEVAPIFERSGCKSWTEFCVRFAYGFPQVQSTVGSTSKLANLQEFLNAVKDIKPLPADIQSEIIKLQYRWSDETDVLAEPWTM